MSTWDEDLEKTLYICKECESFYVLSVAASAKKQDCPVSGSHGVMSVVTDRTSWATWSTCVTKGCESYLSTVVDQDDKERCEKCNKPVIQAGDLSLDGLDDYTASSESDEMHSSIRHLKSEIEKHKDWKTSHHSGTTSKGAKKSGTVAAAEKHSKAGHADRIQRENKVKFLNEALTAVIKWRLKQGDTISAANLKHYKDFSETATSLITKLGGTPVTEFSVD